MKVGDLVEAMYWEDLKISVGIILSELPPMELGLQVFEVLRGNGKIDIYSSAALTVIK